MNKKRILAWLISLSLLTSIILPAKLIFAADHPFIPSRSSVLNDTGVTETDVRDIFDAVLDYLLGFLGILAVVIILIGGFRWMTAGGDAKKTEPALNTIKAGSIGLIIILAAWAIVKIVLSFAVGLTSESVIGS